LLRCQSPDATDVKSNMDRGQRICPLFYYSLNLITVSVGIKKRRGRLWYFKVLFKIY
jgi:hypothetical protein